MERFYRGTDSGTTKSQRRWLAVLLIWLAFALMVSSALQKSATVDEQSHLFRGVAYLREGATHFLLGHPLGVSVLTALPVLTEPNLQLPLDSPAWEAGNWSVAGDLFMWRLNEYPQRLLFLGRLPVMWLTLLLLALVYRWGRELAGGKVALFAMLLLAVDPNVLANGRIISGDVPLTLFFVLTLYGFWRWAARSGSWQALLAAGLGLGLASVSKFNAGLLLPILGLLGLFLAWRRRSWRPLLVLIVVGAVGSVIIWGVYGFGLRPYPGGAFWDDLFWVLDYFGKPHGAYLAGNYSPTGWWYYFPFVFAIKTPLPTLGLLLAAILGFVFRWLSARKSKKVEAEKGGDVLFLLLPVLVYLGASLTSNLNIGYRHLLPVLPFLWLFTAVSFNKLPPKWHKPARLLSGAAALWLVGQALFIWPNYIPFFNLFAGGPDHAWRLLSDSNIDWGQDLPALAEWQRENGAEVKLSYFGTAHPSAYGIRFEPMPMWLPAPEWALPGRQLYDPLNPAPGVYALSVTSLHGVVLGEQRDAFAWFREQTPLARLGGSIFLYEVSAKGEPVHVVLYGVEPAQLAATLRERLMGNDLQVRWLDGRSAMLWPAAGGWLVVGAGQELMMEGIRPFPDAELMIEANGQRLYRLPVPQFAGRVSYRFAEQLNLLDVAYVSGENGDGDEIALVTTWQVLNQTDRPLKLFVHALDEQGQIVGQWDGLSIEPTSWQSSDVFIQQHQFSLSSAGNPAQFLIGLYDGETLERVGEPFTFLTD